MAESLDWPGLLTEGDGESFVAQPRGTPPGGR